MSLRHPVYHISYDVHTEALLSSDRRAHWVPHHWVQKSLPCVQESLVGCPAMSTYENTYGVSMYTYRNTYGGSLVLYIHTRLSSKHIARHPTQCQHIAGHQIQCQHMIIIFPLLNRSWRYKVVTNNMFSCPIQSILLKVPCLKTPRA